MGALRLRGYGFVARNLGSAQVDFTRVDAIITRSRLLLLHHYLSNNYHHTIQYLQVLRLDTFSDIKELCC